MTEYYENFKKYWYILDKNSTYNEYDHYNPEIIEKHTFICRACFGVRCTKIQPEEIKEIDARKCMYCINGIWKIGVTRSKPRNFVEDCWVSDAKEGVGEKLIKELEKLFCKDCFGGKFTAEDIQEWNEAYDEDCSPNFGIIDDYDPETGEDTIDGKKVKYSGSNKWI